MTLHPLIGHEDARQAASVSFAAGRLPSALLLTGPRGVGKQRFALWIAQLVVCEGPQAVEGEANAPAREPAVRSTGAAGPGDAPGGSAGDAPAATRPVEPCGVCPSCRMVLRLEHPDVHWYFPLPRPKGVSADRLPDALEDARHEAIRLRREQPLGRLTPDDVTGLYLGTVKNIRARAHMRATMAPGPVFIIGDADELVPQEASQEAANALLKLLEEPPGGTRFILTSSEAGRLLPTIRSRSVPLHLGPIDEERVAEALRAYADAGEEEARTAARLSLGSLGRALGFLAADDEEHGPLDQLRRRAFQIVRAALEPGRTHVLAMDYPPAKARLLLPLFGFVEEWLRDLAALLAGAPEGVIHADAAQALEALGRKAGVEAGRVPASLAELERARELARGNVNPQLVVGSLARGLRRALVGSGPPGARNGPARGAGASRSTSSPAPSSP